MNECIFCRIVEGSVSSFKVYEDDEVLGFLDIYPSAPGHTLLIPKAHVGLVEDMEDSDASALFKVLPKIVAAIQAALEVSASTIGINNGYQAGQEIPHVHVHIIPRKTRSQGGIIQTIVHRERPAKEKFQGIAEKIKIELESILG
jgi:histidine triad (HIT) family protein